MDILSREVNLSKLLCLPSEKGFALKGNKYSQAGGAFSGDFTINVSLQSRAFSRALKTEKLKAQLFPVSVGAGNTNGWCTIDKKYPNLLLYLFY